MFSIYCDLHLSFPPDSHRIEGNKLSERLSCRFACVDDDLGSDDAFSPSQREILRSCRAFVLRSVNGNVIPALTAAYDAKKLIIYINRLVHHTAITSRS